MTAKYDPLRKLLSAAREDRLRLSFNEIERALGFDLPRSARLYAPWWANVRTGHAQADAWMGAGWRAREVDVAGEKVTFERMRADEGATEGVREAGARFLRDDARIGLGLLSPAAAATYARYLEEAGGDTGAALSRALEDAELTRRRRLVDWFKAHSPSVAGDSADIVREGRDAR
ncbi:MAG: DUF7662 domain-containing protein [Caulobacteraceae bacterium]